MSGLVDQSNADVPTVARASNRFESTQSVALDISRAFDKVWHTSLLNKFKSNRISGQIFGFILSFLSNRRLQVALDGKSSQEYLVNAVFPQGLGSYSLPTIH